MIKIFRDNFGIPHIEVDNYIEAVYAIGYVHCEDDFYTIQQWLLSSRKQSGHVDDWDAPYIDFICDFFEIEKHAKRLKQNISVEYLDLVKSYCKALNSYAKDNPNDVLKPNLFPISDLDLIKTQHLMEVLGTQLDIPYSFLNNRDIKIPKRQGSNIVAITKIKSECGNAKIAINPHQQMEGLFSFYEIHLKIDRPNVELYGFILPCTFAIFMGTNFKTAWGFTANYPEMYDIFKLDVSGLRNKYVIVDEQKVELRPKYYKNYTKLYGKIPFPILKKYYKTKLGNVLKIKGEYFFIKMHLLGKSLGSEINHELAKCSTTSEIKTLCIEKRYGYLNLVSIDSDDNILFVHNSLEKIKENNDLHYQNIIELTSKSQIADQFYGPENLIFKENPECGYIVSSNQSPFKVSDDEELPSANSYRGLLYFKENSRSLRIKSLLRAKESLNISDLKEILFDTKVIKPVIRNVDFSVLFNLRETDYPKLSSLISILKNWDGNADLNSEGSAAFSLFYHYYKEKYYIPSKNPDQIQLANIKQTLSCLSWTAKFFKPSMQLKDIQFIKRGKVILPISGIPDSTSSIRPYFEKGKLYAEEGGAFRLIIDLKNRQIFACHPFGSSSNLDDNNSTNQMELFVNNQYREIEHFDFYKTQYRHYTLSL